MPSPLVWFLFAGGGAVAVAASTSSSKTTKATKVTANRSVTEGEIRAQMTACERIVSRRASVARTSNTKFIIDVTSGIIDKIDPGIGLLGSSTDDRKRKMEDDYWKAFGTLFPKFWADFMRGWWNSWRKFWTNLLVSLGLIDTSPDERYSQEWINRAEAAFNNSMSLGVPLFQGFHNLNDPRAYSKDNLPVPKWVTQEMEYTVESFSRLSQSDREVLRDFWLRALKLRDGAAKVLFAGVGATKNCPEIECSEVVHGVRRGCQMFEWENCAQSLQPIFDPQSLTYVAAQVYASSYGTRVSSAQWYALEEEFKQFWKGDTIDLMRVFPDRAKMGENFYRDSIRNIALYVVAPYNLPLPSFVKMLRIASAAAKRAPVEKPIRLAPISMP